MINVTTKKPLIYLTTNPHKVEEANKFFVEKYGFNIEIVNPDFEIIEKQAENCLEVAAFSAQYAANKLGVNALKSDTGIYLDCLGGLPGPYSAYFDKQIGAKKFLEIKQEHSGIYAVIFNQDKTAILTVHKIRGPYKGQYDLPGGSPEEGETKKQTLEREILEEIGAHLNYFDQWYELDFIVREDSTGDRINFHHRALFTLATIKDINHNSVEKAVHDTDAVKWVSLENWQNNPTLSLLIKKAIQKMNL